MKAVESPLDRASKNFLTVVPRPERVSLPDPPGGQEDLICFSHLRWDFVFQRPQHLLTRFASERRVFFVEEPIFEDVHRGSLETKISREGVTVLTPKLKRGLEESEINLRLKWLLDRFFASQVSRDYIFWYYTPMALPFTRHFKPAAIVYDCMDELSAFAGAHPALLRRERELMSAANVVFTGGHSLYKAKKAHHPNIYPMPSSIDKAHFGKARLKPTDPEDQRHLSRPRIGFFGVIDERMDLELIRRVAELRPSWNLVVLGPVVKIDPAILPKVSNIHCLGGKCYQELPAYLGNWDVAMLPFALNESTKFISPTKTPEYLAGGIPVVSTPITDVVDPYGNLNLVHIARTPEEFVAAVEKALTQKNDEMWLKRVDRHLMDNSWDNTWARMNALVQDILGAKEQNVRA